RFQENLRRVMVEAEDEAALEGDAVAVKGRHQLLVALRRVETFLRVPQVLSRDRFEAHQNPLAAALLGQREETGVVAQQDGREAIPLDLQGNEGCKELRRVVAVRDQVEIDEDEL